MNLDQWCQTEGVNPVIAKFEERWYHVVLTYDGSTNAAYVDGSFVRAGKPDKAPNTQTSGGAMMVLGGNPGNANYDSHPSPNLSPNPNHIPGVSPRPSPSPNFNLNPKP